MSSHEVQGRVDDELRAAVHRIVRAADEAEQAGHDGEANRIRNEGVAKLIEAGNDPGTVRGALWGADTAHAWEKGTRLDDLR